MTRTWFERRYLSDPAIARALRECGEGENKGKPGPCPKAGGSESTGGSGSTGDSDSGGSVKQATVARFAEIKTGTPALYRQLHNDGALQQYANTLRSDGKQAAEAELAAATKDAQASVHRSQAETLVDKLPRANALSDKLVAVEASANDRLVQAGNPHRVVFIPGAGSVRGQWNVVKPDGELLYQPQMPDKPEPRDAEIVQAEQVHLQGDVAKAAIARVRK